MSWPDLVYTFGKMSQKYKVVFVGDQASGKTSLVRRYMYNNFEESVVPTIGMDFQSKNVTLDSGRSLRLQLWDTAGQERFRSLIPSYMRDASAAVVVFDLTARPSFEAVKTWVEYIRNERGDECVTTLVGNKVDLTEERAVSTEDGSALAQELGIKYFEVSAKAGDNVVELFTEIATGMPEKASPEQRQATGSGGPPAAPITLSASEQAGDVHRKKKKKCEC